MYRVEPLEGRTLLSFVAPLTFDAGSGPRSVAVGEFNGDGRPDLAVVNFPSAGNLTISVLLGNGDGTFQPPRHIPFPFGQVPVAVAVGEFNGDGRQDLVAADYYENDAVVLLGNGDGTFQAPRRFAVGLRPVSVAVGDFNGDGRPDLAVGNDFDANISVLLGNGDGSFQARRNFPAWVTYSVAVADFNRDGHQDLVSVGGSDVSVLLGNGDGTFQPRRTFAAGGLSRSVAVGEFNGDGIPDLVTGTMILLGNGDGTFRAARAHGGSGELVVAADFNADGRQDVAATFAGGVRVVLGNGDGTFQSPRSFSGGTGHSALVVGDFDGDGHLDLAAAHRDSLIVSVLRGAGDGTFRAARTFPAGAAPQAVTTGDLNRDGHLDLVVANRDSNTVSVLLGTGDGAFGAARNFTAGGGPIAVELADFNGDGRPDLAVANLFGGTVSVLAGGGDGTFAAARHFPAGAAELTSMAVGDFNGDGRPDVATTYFRRDCGEEGCGSTEEGLWVLPGNGDGTLGSEHPFAAGPLPIASAAGDFNGDGRQDLVVANYEAGSISIFTGGGEGGVGGGLTFAAGSGPVALAVGDFNRDGRRDLAVANLDSNDVSMLLGNGDGTFASAGSFAAGSRPRSLAVGDFNGDGRPDLAVISSGGVRVLSGNGDGTLQDTHVGYLAGAFPTSVAVGDFNGDRRPDLAVANGVSDDVSILINNANWPAALPAVQQVYVFGSGWADEFKRFLDDKGLGSARYGFAVPAGDQLNELPWIGLDQVSITFSQGVRVDQDDLRVTGVNVPAYAISSFAYDAGANTATWTLGRSLVNDRVVLELDGDAGGISDPQGRLLDGEWTTGPASAFPSGDGSPGGDFRFAFNVLPGDTTGDGRVLAQDYVDVKKKFFKNTSSPLTGTDADYSAFHDIDGSGNILATDYAEVKKRFFTTLPLAQAAAAPLAVFGESAIAGHRALLDPPRRGVLDDDRASALG